jgi:hypothetical protein
MRSLILGVMILISKSSGESMMMISWGIIVERCSRSCLVSKEVFIISWFIKLEERFLLRIELMIWVFIYPCFIWIKALFRINREAPVISPILPVLLDFMIDPPLIALTLPFMIFPPLMKLSSSLISRPIPSLSLCIPISRRPLYVAYPSCCLLVKKPSREELLGARLEWELRPFKGWLGDNRIEVVL